MESIGVITAALLTISAIVGTVYARSTRRTGRIRGTEAVIYVARELFERGALSEGFMIADSEEYAA